MCGIVAASAHRNIVGDLIAGLQALEYRGYDSAGIAIYAGTELIRRRAVGKVSALSVELAADPVQAHAGIAHTRWATHGVPSTENAHPHASGQRVAVVHNGIIENDRALRAELVADGYSFVSQTDTEVIAHLIARELDAGLGLLAAVQAATRRLEGAYAIAVIASDAPETIVGARQGSPLVVGLGDGEHYLASDIHALLRLTQRVIYLNDGDLVEFSAESLRLIDRQGQSASRDVVHSALRAQAIERGLYRHFMEKEIHEQPQALTDTLEGRLHDGRVLPGILGPTADEMLTRVRAVRLVACGTSYHAALVGRHWIEQYARLPAVAEIASEFRYREPVVEDGTLFVSLSQSGETMDTLAALRMAKQMGYLETLAICNVAESSLVRESALKLMTRAGPEIGVASTKAFTTQLAALALLTLTLALRHPALQDRARGLARELEQLPATVHRILGLDEQIRRLAKRFVDKRHAFFLGRGAHWPIALEGALKLKEISYIHAEAYPAGELKHGPLALIDSDMPVIAVAPSDALIEKLRSNLQEVRARGAELYLIADENAIHGLDANPETLFVVPRVGDLTSPILMTVPLQMLAYHVAVERGTDVDQPRNLAKSVTVE